MDFQITPVNPPIRYGLEGIKSKKSKKWFFILSGVFVVVGLAFFLLGRTSFSESKVELKINGPAEISSGGKVTYSIEYKNGNKQALQNLKLAFFYPPDSIVLKDGQISQFLTENIELADLGPDESGKTEFSAYLVGNRGDIKKANVLLVYSPESIRSTFEKESDLATNITSLAISLTLVAPPSAISGQELAYILDYRNESQEEFTDLKLKFAYPDSFSVSRFSPLPTFGQNTWEIKSIKPGEGQRISIFGVLRGSERENKPVSVILQRKVDGTFIDFEKSSSGTAISTPPLSVAIKANNRSNYIAKLGDELDYEISFANNSNIDLLGLTITVKLEGVMFDTSTLAGNGFFDGSAKSVIWNASSSPLLNKLASGQKGSVNFRIKIKENFAGGGFGGAKDFVVKVSAKAETPTIPEGFDFDRLGADAELVTKISSLPVLDQSGIYNDEVYGASGPFPPKANQKTFYTILWEVSNTSNDFSKTRVKGVLPAGVNWENKARVNGQQTIPVFKPTFREVVWDLGVLPAGTGNQFPKYQAWFQVSFTPSGNNVGQPASLIKNMFLEGEDSFTRQAILVRVNDITTNDLVDFPGQGSVTE